MTGQSWSRREEAADAHADQTCRPGALRGGPSSWRSGEMQPTAGLHGRKGKLASGWRAACRGGPGGRGGSTERTLLPTGEVKACSAISQQHSQLCEAGCSRAWGHENL